MYPVTLGSVRETSTQDYVTEKGISSFSSEKEIHTLYNQTTHGIFIDKKKDVTTTSKWNV